MSREARILVVDDSDAGRYLKAHVLRKAGYRIIEAASGRAALELCRDAGPDLVLLDVRLPDRNGTEVAREIKANFANLMVLQTSAAVTTAQDRAQALDGGADTFLVEPIEPEELLANVRALLRLHDAERALRDLNETLEHQVAERTTALIEANERLQAESDERRKAEEVLWHTQKLEVVGQLTGGIAHDFNNLLSVIVASTEMVRAALQREGEVPRAKVLKLLSTTEAATDRGGKLTRQLLAFARRGALRSETVALDEVIVACEPFLRRALGEANELHLDFAPGLWSCNIDPAQFEAAILNLVVNARDAMPRGGTLSISTSNETIERITRRGGTDLLPGDYVRIRITDTGSGMEPHVLARVFEPFFTTKEVGKGTGLGLSQVYGFVQQSNGQITIDSEQGRGTTFELCLPRSRGARTAPALRDDASAAIPTGHETVLVVEDNAEVRELAVAAISDLGYRVLAAPDGAEALDILEHEDRIDLLFSDVVLPGSLNGFELVNKAREMRGGLKALVTSGYANVRRPGTDRPDVPLLVKPYRRSELAEHIREALDRV